MRFFRGQARTTAESVEQLAKKADVDGLVAVLRGGQDFVVVKAAAEALGDLGDARAAEPLVEVLRDRVAEVVRGTVVPGISDAAHALGKLQERDRRMVDPLVEPLIKELVAALAKTSHLDTDAHVCRVLADTLGELRATAPLIAVLRGDNWRVRAFAAQWLGHIADPAAVEPLMASLEDQSESVRMDSAAALGSIGDQRAVEPLIEALADYVTRDKAIPALGKLGNPVAVGALASAFPNVGQFQQGQIVDALTRIGGPEAEAAVANLRARQG